MSDESCPERHLSDREWRVLLREIRRAQVIPVIGPGLVSIDDPHTGNAIPLYQYLAPILAEELGLTGHDGCHSINEVARQFLLTGGKRNELYISLGEILEGLDCQPSQTLLDLTRITDFNLFISSTVDPLLARAVDATRPGFAPERGVIRFHYKGNPERPGMSPLSGNPLSPCDLPATFKGPLVYHILGDYRTQPDFAVWEEDYMEFICGLIESRDMLTNLFRNLASRHLLLLGAPSQDWIVRFFLRAARGARLSESGDGDYLADYCHLLGEPLVFYFDKVVKTTRIIDGDPADFVRELSARWRELYGPSDTPETFIQQQPEHMPRGSVFVSYSHDDLDTTVRVAHALHLAGVPVWLDKQRLQAGENYETRLEHAIKHDASFFLSLISRATEGNPDRYVHKERRWAAQKHVDGYVYYMPLVIDDVDPIRLEPQCFSKIHRDRLSDAVLPKFVQRMCSLMEQYRDSGYPRG